MELFYGSMYFSLEELTHTDSSLDNQPKLFVDVVNLLALQCFLDDLREKLGKPIIVNSAFRTFDVNLAVEGAENSYHLKGLAADIRVQGMAPLALKEFIGQNYCASDYVELKAYSTFVHVAINRRYWLLRVCKQFNRDLAFNKL